MDTLTLKTPVTTKPATVVTIPLQEHPIEYVIEQSAQNYQLKGNFTDTTQQAELAVLFEEQNRKLTIGNTSTNRTLLEKGSITLTKEIIPHFVKTYQKGKISYIAEVLTVEGEVDNYEAKHHMQKLLAASSVASKNNTHVILPKKPINFVIHHDMQNNTLSGHFSDTRQERALQNTFRKLNHTLNSVHLSEDQKLHDFGGIALTQEILPEFTQSYTQGEINYQDKLLTVKGKVKDEAAKLRMEKILQTANIPTKDLTVIDTEYLQRLAEAKKAEEEAKLAAENRKLAAEKARLEQEAAQTQAQLEAEKARQAEAQRKAEAEKERLAQEEQAKLAREAAAKKILQAKEAKENIRKLLKVENIEFNTAKSTLTDRGQNTVNKLASILKRYPDVRIEIAGHTDSDGKEEFNQKLSQSRVNTVKNALVSQGIVFDRLLAKGYGESKPLVPNSTDENKQKNRRVEINIIGE
jgi:outer membrane protein OmpA-like peptidoglycan-associated protein